MATEINRNVAVAVGTSLVELSYAVNYPTNERKVISIINTSTAGQKITVSIGDEAAGSAGIVLSPGGYYHESHDSGFTPTQSRITAVSDNPLGQVSLQERIIVRL